jgi:hypothetical protein
MCGNQLASLSYEIVGLYELCMTNTYNSALVQRRGIYYLGRFGVGILTSLRF